jgi:hypothetical protein
MISYLSSPIESFFHMIELWRTCVENVTGCFPSLNNTLTELGSEISGDVCADKMGHYETYKLKVKEYLPLVVEDFSVAKQSIHALWQSKDYQRNSVRN